MSSDSQCLLLFPYDSLVLFNVSLSLGASSLLCIACLCICRYLSASSHNVRSSLSPILT
jgi:hypothetical protein